MLLVPILALVLTPSGTPQAGAPPTYAACVATPEPVVCVADLAVAGDRGFELTDLVAAGAVAPARRQAPARGRRIVELAARIAAGEGHEGLSPVEAQHVLGLFSDVSFYDSGLPGDARAIGLWDIAMREPVGDIELRGILAQVAGRSGLDDLARRLVAEAPVGGRWSDDERAYFAGVAAWSADDWRVAEAFMASGGDRAEGYSVSETRLGVDQARLRSGYEREAAARVLAAVLAEDKLPPGPGDGPEALKAGGATDELRALATALVSRGRAPDRSPEDRTDDFGLASWAYEAAGDRDMALSAAREGAALTPLAVAERISLHSNPGSLSPAEAAEMVNGFGTWPVQRLYELGVRDEALAVGFLAGRDRYLADLEADVTPDPSWLAKPRIDNQLELVVPALQRRGASSDAMALLVRLRAAPADWASAGAEELMMLAAIAGDDRQVKAIFDEAVWALDESEDMATWAALQLVIARRAAEAELRRDRTNPQSP
jgi:hypothetical protein